MFWQDPIIVDENIIQKTKTRLLDIDIPVEVLLVGEIICGKPQFNVHIPVTPKYIMQ